MSFEPLALWSLSDIRFEPSRFVFDDRSTALVLRFDGVYRPGSQGNPDATFLVACAKQALAAWDGDGLVFDLRHLDYQWGDGILRLFTVEADPDAAPVPRAAVVSPKCRRALESLLASPRSFLFDRVEGALGAVHHLGEVWRKEAEASEDRLTMYILVRDSAPAAFQGAAIADAPLAVFLRFRDARAMKTWSTGTFKKTICVVSDEELALAKDVEDRVVLTEPSLGHEPIALAFCPRLDWPKSFRFFRRYGEP